MARILYGVAGQGLGHASRSKVVIDHLIENGHEVRILSHDQGFEYLKGHFKVEKIFGLRYKYENNEVRYFHTILKNIAKFPQASKSFNQVLKLIESFKPGLVITDFEPISGLAENVKKIPLATIDNIHVFSKTRMIYPKKHEKEILAAKAFMKLMAFSPEAYLITTFFKSPVVGRNTYTFPPILRKEVLRKKSGGKGRILVYMTAGHTEILEILRLLDAKFIVYGFDEDRQEKNITLKKASQSGFLDDLANSRAVIATAGFNLITEALHLGKPYLAFPVKGQIEQIWNAYYL